MGPLSPSTEQRPRGRPRVQAGRDEVARLRIQGLSFRRIARALGIAIGTAHGLGRAGPAPWMPRKPVQKIPQHAFGQDLTPRYGVRPSGGQARRGPQRPETPTGPANHAWREGFA